jgi:hypothetical protein
MTNKNGTHFFLEKCLSFMLLAFRVTR